MYIYIFKTGRARITKYRTVYMNTFSNVVVSFVIFPMGSCPEYSRWAWGPNGPHWALMGWALMGPGGRSWARPL